MPAESTFEGREAFRRWHERPVLRSAPSTHDDCNARKRVRLKVLSMSKRVLSVYAAAALETDGVADHAELLTAALKRAGHHAETSAVDWRRSGWITAFRQLLGFRRGDPDLVVLHYSHLAWSRKGLPVGLVGVLVVCRFTAPVVLWVHDPGRVEGFRARQRAGSFAKRVGLQLAARIASDVIVSVDPSRVYWIDPTKAKDVKFCPSPSNVPGVARRPPSDMFTVSTFGTDLTGNGRLLSTIEAVMRIVVSEVGPVRLRVLGANDCGRQDAINRLARLGIDVEVPGRLSAADLANALSESHVFFHANGLITSRSGTLAAALACGLPVVGMLGEETGFPLDTGDLQIVGDRDTAGMAERLIELARNPKLQARLAAASLDIHEAHYSWASAAQMVLTSIDSALAVESGPTN